MIDWSKPIECEERPDWQFTVLTTSFTLGGRDVVAIQITRPYEDSLTVYRTLDNQYPGHRDGSMYALRNKIEVTSGFFPLDKTGMPYGARGLISLSFAEDEYPGTLYFIEIVKHDGKPVRAEVHHANPH